MIRLVLGETGRLVLVGILVGGIAAVVTTRHVAPFLFGVTPSDPTTWIASAAMLAMVGLLAGALPAWRAASMDANAALRAE